nr:unnamed protein product [Callosobruchus analis]
MPSKIEVPMNHCVTLRPHQEDLLQLSELAGIHMDKKVFRLIMEMLNMGFNAETIYSLLKYIKKSRTRKPRVLLHKQMKPK